MDEPSTASSDESEPLLRLLDFVIASNDREVARLRRQRAMETRQPDIVQRGFEENSKRAA